MRRLEEARERLLAPWSRFAEELGADEPSFLRRLREEGRGRFEELGLPTTRLEEWRYTNVAPIAEVPFRRPAGGRIPITRRQIEAISFPVFACSLFVFVNGRYEPELSAPRALSHDLQVESFARLRAETPARLESVLGQVASLKEHPFAALNTAFLEDGALVTLPRGTEVDQAIHLVFVSAGDHPTLSHPRVLIVAEPESRATVIQDHVSLDPGPAPAPRFTNALTEVVVQENAALDLVILQRESENTRLVSNLASRQERDARFRSHTVTLGGLLVRNDLGILLGDEGAECTVNGLFVATGSQLVDNHTVVDHAVPHCASRELYKGILGGRAKGVFRGRVVVRPDAQKTDARQSNPNLLLGDGAEINTKPQLEIYADDVKCSHGSAIGRIDPDALFYLRTRGMQEIAARELLTQGFAHEILANLPHEALTESLSTLLLEGLRKAGGQVPS